MKKVTVLILFFVGFLSTTINAQETIWLDEDLKITDQSKAVFYKIGSKLDGQVMYFYKSRTAFRKVYFVNGRLDGFFYEYYKSGELKETGKYEKGLREGSWKTYYINGKIKEKGKYNTGEKVGIWKTFYKNL